MKRFFIIFVNLLIFVTFNLASYEPEILNGGWLDKKCFDRLKNGDEFFVDQMSTMNINGIEYLYCTAGTLIDLSSSKPRFCITYFNDFDVININKKSDTTFEFELSNRHANIITGKILITMETSEIFYLEIIDGTDNFVSEMNIFTIQKNCLFYFLGTKDSIYQSGIKVDIQ